MLEGFLLFAAIASITTIAAYTTRVLGLGLAVCILFAIDLTQGIPQEESEVTLTKGMKSSEFWIHLGMQIVLFLNTTHAWTFVSPKYSVIAQSVIAFAYMHSRGLAKQGTNTSTSTSIN